MAGDHACSVCQATFTRPQHVARHMRSHTGDRPYKCQHCGDQFSRSDLLNRHIKKCHPDAEDPTANKDGSKRKTSSINRAVTSKQACDQCVQSSLPCNGSNPCSKCIQRKVRCTYVMFHRQTAPAGPGHPAATPFTSHPYEISTAQAPYPSAPPTHHQAYMQPQTFDGSMARYGRSASLSYHDQPRPSFDIPASAGHSRRLGLTSESSNSSQIPFDFDLEFEDSRSSQSVENMYCTPGRNNVSMNYQYPTGDTSQLPPAPNDQPRPSSSHFHSAFGLLSLEDPKTENNTPFFSNHGQPTDIPTRPSPESVSAASSYSSSSSGFHPGSSTSSYSSVGNLSDASWKESMDPLQPPREAETRELREFWRQYQSQTQSSHSPPQSQYENNAAVTPSASHRQRINAANVKTPTADAYTSVKDEGDNYGWYPPGTTARAAAGVGVVNHNVRPAHEHPSAPPPLPSQSHLDDLKSYEAAVMARQVNTDLVMPSLARSVGAGNERPNYKRLPSHILAPDTAKKVRG